MGIIMKIDQPYTFLVICNDQIHVKINKHDIPKILKHLKSNGHSTKSAMEWIDSYMYYGGYDDIVNHNHINIRWNPVAL